jgi:hypothetical protein
METKAELGKTKAELETKAKLTEAELEKLELTKAELEKLELPQPPGRQRTIPTSV